MSDFNQDPNCIFCKIVQGDVSCYKVYEDSLSLAFLSIDPLSPGHTLVIPKAHYEFIWDIDDSALYSHLFLVAKKIAAKLKGVNDPKVVLEVVEGLEVPHAHIHLIPAETGYGELAAAHATKSPTETDPEQLAKEAKKISEAPV